MEFHGGFLAYIIKYNMQIRKRQETEFRGVS